jgi:hypothetical protein
MLSTYVLFAGGSRPKRTRYVDPSLAHHQEHQDARVTAAMKKIELMMKLKKMMIKEMMTKEMMMRKMRTSMIMRSDLVLLSSFLAS